jgi:hypothetical protein
MTDSLDQEQREPWAADLRLRYPTASSTVFECHKGWRPLLGRLLEKLEVAIAKEAPETRADFRVVQIQQRFGHLMVDLSTEPTPEMKAAIEEASAASASTCEICSAPGRMADRSGWTAVRCSAHEQWSVTPSEHPLESPAMRGEDQTGYDDRPEVMALLSNLKAALPRLEALLEESSSHWRYEDPVYRFYHQSFKVYGLQTTTVTIVEALQALAPERQLHQRFRAILFGRHGSVVPCHPQPSMARRDAPDRRSIFPCPLLPGNGGSLRQRAGKAARAPAQRLGGAFDFVRAPVASTRPLAATAASGAPR